MTTVLTLSEMVNLALGTPEVGCVNYNALHTLLHAIIAKLHMSDVPVQLGRLSVRTHGSPTDERLSPMESEEWGNWVGSMPSIADGANDEGKKEKESRAEKENVGGGGGGGGTKGGKVEKDKGSGGGAEKSTDVDKGAGGGSGGGGKEKVSGGGKDKAAGGTADKATAEKSKRESLKATGAEASRGRKGSSGKGGVGSPGGGTDSVPLMVNSMPFHELAKKVEKLEEAWRDLNELQKIDPFNTSGDEKGVPLHDMWETLQFQKRLDANTEGVDKLMGLVQEILHRIQKLAESDAEQMALITGSHQKIESLAPKADVDAMKQDLNAISDKVDTLQLKDASLTWENLESALKGSGHQDSVEESHASIDQGASLKDDEESELVVIVKDGDEVLLEGGAGRIDGASGKGGKSGKSGKGGKDKHKHESGKEGGVSEHPGDKGQETDGRGQETAGKGQETAGKEHETAGKGQSATKDGKAGEKEGGTHDGGSISGSGRQLDNKEGSWDDTGSRRSSGGGKAGPSPDLQSVLGALGKLDNKFKALLTRVAGIENTIPQKDIFNNVTADTMKRMSDSAIVIETTREQMRDFNDELTRSYLDHLRNANEIIATLKDTANCPSSVPPKDEEEYKLTGRRSHAIGALEKAMKLVDKTFGILYRGVQNLDCKLTNQTIKWEERLSNLAELPGSRPGSGSPQLTESPSMEDEACKDEEPEQTAVDTQSRLKELEKRLGLRKDEMCKMTKRLNQLNRAISQQLTDAKDRLNDLESRLSDMTCDLKRLIQRIEADRGGEYVVPTAAVLDGSGVSLLIGVQKALDDLKTDMEKLSGKTDSLQQNNAKHHDSIEDLLKFANDLDERKKGDNADFIEKAAKQDLDLKLDSRVFELTCDEMTKNVNSLLGRVSRLDEECKNSFDKLTNELSGCMTSSEFDRIRDCMSKQFKVLAKKLAKMQKQLEIAKLVGDDAAGIRRQLFKCLSCDRTILMASQDPKPALPNRDGLFPYRSTKPYTTYELEQIRQHARCFQIPKGLSNYERAVIERQLSRFKIRDLRGNANPYWKQDHSSSNIKHIRTSAVSPNSQGDRAASPSADDPNSFPDPYACTRPCGGSHTLTSPYKRVIHMADINSVIMSDEQNTNQQNHENTVSSSMLTEKSSPVAPEKTLMTADKGPVVVEKGPVVNAEVTENDHPSLSANQVSLTSSDDNGQVRVKSRTDSLGEISSQSNPQPPPNAVAAPHSVLKQLSDDSGRRFSDPTIIGAVAKKPDLKKGNTKSGGGDRRISAPNASSSVGSPPHSATYMKKRRFSTPVTLSTREGSNQSTHLKKHLKGHEVKEEEDDAEEEETTNNTHRDNSDHQ